MDRQWGPLAPLAGAWEGDGGVDVAYSHQRGRVVCTPYRERATFEPFGPVRNGRQRLFGLDHRTTMWRADESIPFHTEVGYWLWDPDSGEVLRAFVVPRGVAVLAGGTAGVDDRELRLAADRHGPDRAHDPDRAIGESRYLAAHASSLRYRATITTNRDGTWSYRETTTLRMRPLPEPLAHTDRNTLHRIA
ncbi:MAG TPA: heme-binding beta-barrel domain-containing protein [Acidimicrobiales bacterium]